MAKDYIKIAAKEFVAFARKWPDLGMLPCCYSSPIGEIEVQFGPDNIVVVRHAGDVVGHFHAEELTED